MFPAERSFVTSFLYMLVHVKINKKLDVVGVIPLFSSYAMILFDSGASHSFVSLNFVKAYDVKMDDGNQEWHVRVPTGDTQISKAICK